MRRFVIAVALFGCAAKRPPPQVCEPPPPEPKKIAVGSCPITYVDAGSDAADSDARYDAPR